MGSGRLALVLRLHAAGARFRPRTGCFCSSSRTGNTILKGVSPMRLRSCGVSFACLLALAVSVLCCNNALDPLCGSSRPAPLIGSLSPSTLTVTQLQQGETLTINGSNFVSSSEVLINSTPLGATVVSPQEMTVKLTTDAIRAPRKAKLMVETPSGNTGDLGCSSGGKSSVLMLTVN